MYLKIRIAQRWDPKLCRFIELLHEHAVVDVDQLILDPCHQEMTNWIRDKLAHKIVDDKVVKMGTDTRRPP